MLINVKPSIFGLLFLIAINITAYAQISDTLNAKPLLDSTHTIVTYDTIFLSPDTVTYIDTVYQYYDDLVKNTIEFQAEVFFSPLLFSSKYSFSDIENDEYGQLFEKAHSPELSYSFGANFSLAYKKLLFQSGINYTVFNEDFDYNAPAYLSIDTNIYFSIDTLDTYYIVEGTDTSWFYITEEKEYTQIDTSQHQNSFTSRNSYSYIEFPLIFGYTITKNKFSILPKTGLIIGLLQQTKGKTIDPNNYQDIADLNDLSGSMFTTVPLFIYLSLGIQYHLAEKTALFVEPYYRQQLNSMYKNDFPVSRKIRAMGVKFGFAIKI